MAKKPFSVSDYIKPEDVSKLDTEATAITFIPRERLLQNEKNFYDTSSIDELADSIALNGLIEPIIVRPVRDGSGDYRIISGHRRFLAISELAKDEPERWARVPAIIREPASDVLEELLLIEANRATRVMSSADTMRQAERYRELLAELKNQGVEIPGQAARRRGRGDADIGIPPGAAGCYTQESLPGVDGSIRGRQPLRVGGI